MGNFVDGLVAYFSPRAALQRAHARKVLSYYEAAKPGTLRKGRRETGSGNDAILRAGATLRQTARHLEQNYDLALGVLNTLVANVVGPQGIGIEPQPRKADGTIDDVLARQILDLWKDWCRAPEVTKQHDWPSAQRLLCRSWLRDGEVFGQLVSGQIPSLQHGTRVPFSIELLEADFVPMEMQATAPAQVVQGIEINAWGAPTGYHVYKANPLESGSLLTGAGQTKRVPAERMLHLKNTHRIRQLRGVSVFASVLNRFDDLKDYEESERIAAKIAASMAAYIKKGSPDLYAENPDATPRQMKFRPGMVFDDLAPGEEIGMIDTNRPNPNLETYRSGQMKAIAAGAGPTFSSIARTYDGTYSAQRQELVEGYAIYATLANEFIGRIVRPVYEQFIAAAVASGTLRVPAGIAPETLDDATYMPPAMPWIDPRKEAEAWGMLEDRAYASGPEIIRKRGGNPIDVLEQQARWLREKDANSIPHNAAMPDTGTPDDAEESTLIAAQVAALQREPKDTSDLDRQRLALTERIVKSLSFAGDAQ
jgi:lambda family phage portal protein